MSSSNLTRDEARERARLLTVDSYDVSLDLTTGDKVFRSETTAQFSCSEDGASVRLDLVAETVHEIVLNGTSLDPFEVHREDGLHLKGLEPTNVLRVVADLPYMRSGEGLHRFVDPVDGEVYLYTQHETNDAHRTYACFDQPDLKATFALAVTAPEGWKVLSNEAPAAPDPVREGVARWVFPATPPVSTYITAVVAGPYHEVTDAYVRADGSQIPLGLYCRASLGAFLDPAEILEITKQGFAFFEKEFGSPYPFSKYDQVGVAEFNAGAMENAGCVTFHEDYFVFRSKVTDAMRDARANTILHEMAHMWFGDLVTMRWWDDLWLNESFAEFMAYHSASSATRFTHAWTGFATGRKAWGYRQDQLPSTHPIVADAPDIDTVKANFDGITYAKGASVLRQLVAWVGVDHFMAGLRAYFDKHAWGNTTLADLMVELERESGRDLTAWSKEWLETAGCNTLRPAFELAADGTYTAFAVVQEAAASHPTLRAHRIGIGMYDLADGVLTRRHRVEIDVVGASTEVPELVGVKQPDLLLLNDDDLTFAKIRLDERSLATVTSNLARLDSSLARALCWSAAWDMTRDAEMAPSAFVELVANGIGTEDNIVTVQITLRQAQSVIDLYARPEHRDAIRTRLAELLARARPAGAGGQRPPARPAASLRGRVHRGRGPRAAGTAARRNGDPRGAHGGRRPPMAPAPPARRPREAGRPGDRGRAGTRRDVGRAAARRGRPCGPTHGGGEGRGLVEARRPRRAPERVADGDDRRVRGARPARAAPAVRRAVLHLDRPGLGHPYLGDGHQHRDGSVPRDLRRPVRRRSHQRLPRGRAAACRPRPAARRGPVRGGAGAARPSRRRLAAGALPGGFPPGQGWSRCRVRGWRACSANVRRPLTIPPGRSPIANCEVIVRAASAHDRSSSARRATDPVTTSRRRAPGSTATRTLVSARSPRLAWSPRAAGRASAPRSPTNTE